MWHKVVMPAAVVAVVGIALLAGWWLYDLGKVRGVIELKSLRTQYSVQEKRNRKLTKDNRGVA